MEILVGNQTPEVDESGVDPIRGYKRNPLNRNRLANLREAIGFGSKRQQEV
jgi:hypothetical protein